MQKHSLLFLVAILCYITLSSFQCVKEIDSPFYLTSIYPSTGYAGDTITITGRNFLFDSTGEKYAIINDKKIPFIRASSDSLKFIVPLKVGTGYISLHLNDHDYSTYDTRKLFSYQSRAVVTTIAGTGATGNKDGVTTNATFNYPAGIAADDQGMLYVADFYNQSVRKISTTDHTVSSIVLPSNVGGSVFTHPLHLALDKNGHNIYLTGKDRNVMRVTPANDFSIIYDAEHVVTGIAATADGYVYISVPLNYNILKMNSDGQNKSAYKENLFSPGALFWGRNELIYSAVDRSGYITVDNRIEFSTAKGKGADGWEFVMDSPGNIYLADPSCNCIQKSDSKYGGITVIAGSGVAADVDGIGLAASFDSPRGMTIDKDGNLYITTYNTTTHTGNKIRKVSFE